MIKSFKIACLDTKGPESKMATSFGHKKCSQYCLNITKTSSSDPLYMSL